MSVDTAAAVNRIVLRFETLAREDLAGLDAFYTADAYFKDPFNEVMGIAAVRQGFAHMFEALDAPRFRIVSRIAGEGECFLAWEFHFRFKGDARGQVVRGASHLKLADDGRIAWHRDYWDAAEELYEKLPVLGGLMRWLKKRAAG